MLGEVQARPGGLVVFIEEDRGGSACDRLVQALGGRTGGYFRPRRPPQSGRFQWARFYQFDGQERPAVALSVLQIALGSGSAIPADTGIKATTGRLSVDISAGPADTQVKAVGVAIGRLREQLDHHPDGLPGLLPERWERPADSPGRAQVRLGDQILAECLARVLVSYLGAPVGVGASTASQGVRATVAPGEWLQVLAAYCEHHPFHGDDAIADLTPIADAVWRQQWDVARLHAYEVQRGLQPFDRGAMAALELRIATGSHDFETAVALLDADTPPPVSDPLVLRDAVRTRLAQGRPDLAGTLLVGATAETPDGEALIALLSAEVEEEQGRDERALAIALATRFYRPELESDRLAVVDRIAHNLLGRVNEDAGLAERVATLLSQTQDAADGEPLNTLRDAVRTEATRQYAPPAPAALRTPAGAKESPVERFNGILQIARSDPRRGRDALLALLDEEPAHADARLWWCEAAELSRRLRDDDGAVRAYSAALAQPPDETRQLDARNAARALIAILGAGNPERISEASLDRWLEFADDAPGQATLLLLRAERSASSGNIMGAASLFSRGVPDLIQTPSPRLADFYVGQIQQDEQRVRAMLLALDRHLASSSPAVARAADELFSAIDPFDADTFVRLIKADYEAVDGQAVADRFTRILDTLATVPAARTSSRALRDVLAPMAQAFDFAADVLLQGGALGISTEALTDDLAIALTSMLAAGQSGRVTNLLREVLNGPERLRSSPASMVALADTVYAYQDVPTNEMLLLLEELYAAAAYKLVEKYPQLDRALLDAVLRTLEGLRPEQAASVREFLQSYEQPSPTTGKEVADTDRLAGLSIAIVGGDSPVRVRAAKELEAYGAARVLQVPPAYEQSLAESDMRAKLVGADLVLNIWRQTKHQTTDLLKSVIQGISPQPAVLYPEGTGFTSMVRTALKWADERRGTDGAKV